MTIASLASVAPNPMGALSTVPQIGLGIYEAWQANKGLKNLQGQPMPQYSISPEMQSYYNTVQKRSNYGYDPSEKAAFKQNVAQQQNTGFNQAVNMSGGNLAQALNVGFKAQGLNAFNQFAAQDAALHRQNINQWGGAASQMQGQQNLINQQKISQRNMLEQAYGQALRSGLYNVTSGLGSALGMATGAKGGGMGSNPYAQQTQQQNLPTYETDFMQGGMYYQPENGGQQGVNAFYKNTYGQ